MCFLVHWDLQWVKILFSAMIFSTWLIDLSLFIILLCHPLLFTSNHHSSWSLPAYFIQKSFLACSVYISIVLSCVFSMSYTTRSFQRSLDIPWSATSAWRYATASPLLVLGMPLFAAAHLASYGLDPCLQETGSSPGSSLCYADQRNVN